MRKLILIMLIVILTLSVTTIVTNVPAQAFEIPRECGIALWNPTAMATCIAMIVFELWDPLDWGDD